MFVRVIFTIHVTGSSTASHTISATKRIKRRRVEKQLVVALLTWATAGTQSSRLPIIRAARPALVRVRYHLANHLHAQSAGLADSVRIPTPEALTRRLEPNASRMDRRQLGRSGPAVSAMGLGCWSMSGPYGVSDDAEALRTFDRALELGVTFVDTRRLRQRAQRRIVGRALQGRRDRVVLATKFAERSARPVRAASRPAGVRARCLRCLSKAVGIDTIDLYYQHRVDTTVPIEETVGAMAELKAAGKIRHLGLSEASARTCAARGRTRIAALESEYSLFSRDVEDNGVLAAIRELGIALVPYSPLGRGMLTGAVRRTTASRPPIRAHAIRALTAITSRRTWPSSTALPRLPPSSA